MNISIYARGTSYKASDKAQVDAQIEKCRAYIKQKVEDDEHWQNQVVWHTEWTNKNTGKVYRRKVPTPWKQQFVDRGASGTKHLSQRKKWVELVDELQRGDVIVCSKINDLTENALDCSHLLKQMRKQSIGIWIVAFDEDITQSKKFRQITECFAEQERKEHSNRFRNAKHEMKQKGLYRGGTPPFGYDVNADKQLVPNNQYPIVKQIVKWRSEEKTLGQISMFLREQYEIKKSLISVSRIVKYEQEQQRLRTAEKGGNT